MKDLDVTIRSKIFQAVGGAPAHLALRDLHLTGRTGELICLFGPSGCGKTTCLNIIAGLDRDFDGEVSLPGTSDDTPPAIGYVFQSARLLPWRTVLENMHLVLADGSEAAGVDDLLKATGLWEFRHAYPARLSIGMARRAALARAFAIGPDILLMDEPFASLDERTARRVRLLLLDIWSARPTTVLFVTHDLREAIMLSDRIVFLTPPPGTVLLEAIVDIPRSARGDDQAIETYRRRLIADHGEVLGDIL